MPLESDAPLCPVDGTTHSDPEPLVFSLGDNSQGVTSPRRRLLSAMCEQLVTPQAAPALTAEIYIHYNTKSFHLHKKSDWMDGNGFSYHLQGNLRLLVISQW